MARSSNRFAAVITAGFLIIPGLSTIFFAEDNALHIRKHELRDPATIMEWDGYGSLFNPLYFSSVSDWLSDHLGFRPQFVACKNTIDARVLGHTQIGEVHIGKDNWLYFDRSVIAFSRPEVVERAIDLLGTFLDDAPSHRARVLVVVAPDKLSLYPQHLSPSTTRIIGSDAQTRDRFEDFIKQHDGDTLIDMWTRHQTEIRVSGMDTYWERDTHHNPHGQVLMVKSIVQALHPEAWWSGAARPKENLGTRRGDLSRLGSIVYQEMTFQQYHFPNTDRRLDKSTPTEFNGQATQYRATTQGRPLVPGRTLLLHDSFGLEMRWIIPWFFEDITMVNVNHAQLTPNEFYQTLEQYDTVVIEIVERNASSFFSKILDQRKMDTGPADE